MKRVGNGNEDKQNAKNEMQINGKHIKATIDTGSSANIIDEKTYEYIGKPALNRIRLPKLLPYGGGKLNVLGSLDLNTEKNNKITVGRFFVVRGSNGVLLSYDTSCDMQLVQITQNVQTKSKFEDKYPNIYNGIGKLKNKTLKLHINQDVKPVAQSNRRTPFHL